MLPAIHYNGEYCRRAKEPKEEVGADLAWETKLIGLIEIVTVQWWRVKLYW